MIQQLINDEKFTNIQRAQAGLSKLFADAAKTGSFYRVLRNDEPMGVLIPESLWSNLTEDLEALSSVRYRARIASARASKKRTGIRSLKKILNIEK